MNRNIQPGTIARIARQPLTWVAVAATTVAPITAAHADGYPGSNPVSAVYVSADGAAHPFQLAQFDPDRRRPEPLPWSFASHRPDVPRDRATGLFIWHDRNTVHVESTDNHWFGDRFRGAIHITNGSFDNVKDEHDRDDTHFRQVAPDRLVFVFDSQRPDVTGFKFNIHDGDRLVFHVGMDGHRTGRIFYGATRTPAGEDPVIFDLHQ
jgi:hypothetical protein